MFDYLGDLERRNGMAYVERLNGMAYVELAAITLARVHFEALDNLLTSPAQTRPHCWMPMR